MQKPDQSYLTAFSTVGFRGGEERPRRFSFICASLVSALLVGVAAPASAESEQWIQCQGGEDEARIVNCTQLVERGHRGANRERISALLSRGRAYLDKQEFDHAIVDYTSALRLDRRLEAVYRWRARAYRAKGELGRALADVDEALKLDPNATQHYVERGEIYAQKGDQQRAIEDFSAALRRSPELAPAYERRGLAHLARRDIDAAMTDLDKAIALEPNFVDAFLGRAEALRARGDFSLAKRDLETALKLDPSLPSARESLAELSEPNQKRSSQATAAKPAPTKAARRAGEPRLEMFLTHYRSAAVVTEFVLVLAALWFLLSRHTKSALANEIGGTHDAPVFSRERRASWAIVDDHEEQRDERGASDTADQFRHLMQEHEMREDAERVGRRHALEKALEQRVKELAARRLCDDQWRRLLAQARESAAVGMKEFMLIRFPSQLCVDSGRAINAPDANWPQTLRGEPADIFARWRAELAPKGFRLAAQIVEFPDGVPGDAALFLTWEA
jgi:tetratricopeptide (TPR) repeat protein